MSRRTTRDDLLARYGTIAAYIGRIAMLCGPVLAAPALWFPFAPHEAHVLPGLLVPAAGLTGGGALAWRAFRPTDRPIPSFADCALIVVGAWLLAIVGATLSFRWTLGLTWTQALFESTSGWTTTGLSVVDVTTCPDLVLLLRSTLELAGGAGLALLALVLLGGPGGTGLSAAEGRGQLLVPSVVDSARRVVALYAGYALLGTIALAIAGMSVFDAINHALAAVSTGGFSTRPESVGAWDSAAIEGVTVALMVLGTTNFVVVHQLARGEVRAALGNSEWRLMFWLLGVAVPALLVCVGGLYGSLDEAVRVAVFEAVSALSTTGFSSVGYGEWSDAAWLILIGLMLVGGGAGSTAGGLKQARVALIGRAAAHEVSSALRPTAIVNRPWIQASHQGGWLTDAAVRQAAAIAVFHTSALAFGAFVMAWHGASARDALFEMTSAVGTVGLSSGVTHAGAPAAVHLVATAGMFLGRLEYVVVFVGLLRLAQDAGPALRAMVRP